jgi:hypothetical protein
MFKNKMRVLRILPQGVPDRARVLAGQATTEFKLPVGVPIVLRAETTGRCNTWHEQPAGPRPAPHGGRDRSREQTMAKFIQICASQDDLFALDEEGNIYQYNFNAKTWVKLVADRSHEGHA